jgi:phosphoserine phosphatase
MDTWLANVFPLDAEGKLTGGINRPLCYGEGKVLRSKKLAKTHHINLENSYFYTDSYSDLPMLQIVGHPFIINPDPRLKRTAREKKWPILDWKTDVS